MSKPNEELRILLDDATAAQLIALFSRQGFDMRFVGGCVRDALIGRPVGDIDLATNALPGQVLEVLKKNDMRAIPTGVAHGTVTAVLDGRSFEITTLRTDTQTDGRHATVDYTDDWEKDAARRDFTVNALSVDSHGNLHDYFDGKIDLSAKRLRFIGDAAQRIQEDYLRILRYFRFASQLGWTLDNAVELDLCDQNAKYLSRLSKERIQSELFKTLTGPAAAETLSLMQKHGIFTGLIDKPLHILALKKTIALEEKRMEQADPFRRLMSFIGLENSADLSHLMVLSGKQKKRLKEIKAVQQYRQTNRSLTRQLYDFGVDAVKDERLIAGLMKDMEMIGNWQKPVFPLTASDILPLTGQPGPLVGKTLKTLENYWIDNGFQAGHAELVAMAENFIRQ